MKEPGQGYNFRLQTNLWSGRGRRGMRRGRDLASTSRRLLAPCWKPENGQREPTPDNRKKQMSRNGRKEVEIGYTCIQSRAPKTRHRRRGGGVRRRKRREAGWWGKLEKGTPAARHLDVTRLYPLVDFKLSILCLWRAGLGTSVSVSEHNFQFPISEGKEYFWRSHSSFMRGVLLLVPFSFQQLQLSKAAARFVC